MRELTEAARLRLLQACIDAFKAPPEITAKEKHITLLEQIRDGKIDTVDWKEFFAAQVYCGHSRARMAPTGGAQLIITHEHQEFARKILVDLKFQQAAQQTPAPYKKTAAHGPTAKLMRAPSNC